MTRLTLLMDSSPTLSRTTTHQLRTTHTSVIRSPKSGAAAEVKRQTAVSKRGYLVVGLGDCAGCVAFNLRQWETQAREERVPLVGFTLASVSDASKFKSAAGVRTKIITDRNNTLHKSLNCYWSGRVYYYDANWNLLWIMKGFANNKNLHRCPELVALIRSSK